LRHALSVGRLYLFLRQAEADKQLELLTFEPEPRAWRTFSGLQGDTTTLKPDAFAAYDSGDYTLSLFVEVDCGTESPATLSRKLDVYARYYGSGLEQQRHGVFPEVVWLVPNESRRAVVAAVVARQAPQAQQLHRVALYEQAVTVFREQPP
jgi:hypothetical protein